MAEVKGRVRPHGGVFGAALRSSGIVPKGVDSLVARTPHAKGSRPPKRRNSDVSMEAAAAAQTGASAEGKHLMDTDGPVDASPKRHRTARVQEDSPPRSASAPPTTQSLVSLSALSICLSSSQVTVIAPASTKSAGLPIRKAVVSLAGIAQSKSLQQAGGELPTREQVQAQVLALHTPQPRRPAAVELLQTDTDGDGDSDLGLSDGTLTPAETKKPKPLELALEENLASKRTLKNFLKNNDAHNARVAKSLGLEAKTAQELHQRGRTEAIIEIRRLAAKYDIPVTFGASDISEDDSGSVCSMDAPVSRGSPAASRARSGLSIATGGGKAERVEPMPQAAEVEVQGSDPGTPAAVRTGLPPRSANSTPSAKLANPTGRLFQAAVVGLKSEGVVRATKVAK